MFVNPLRSIKKRFEAWRGKKNQQVIPAPEPKPKAFKVPYTSTKDMEFKLSPEVTVFDFRECQSHAKMNRTRQHRQQMKKFHKHQARCNKNYRKRS